MNGGSKQARWAVPVRGLVGERKWAAQPVHDRATQGVVPPPLCEGGGMNTTLCMLPAFGCGRAADSAAGMGLHASIGSRAVAPSSMGSI